MSVAVEVDVASGETEIDAELNEVAGHLNAQHGRLVDLTVRLLADPRLWQGDGVWTIEQFLTWRVGVSSSTARQIAVIARRADELPRCLDALRRGELSLDQVAPIAKRAPWWTDAQISKLATNLTVTQVRRVVSKYPFPDIPNPDAVEADDHGESAGDGSEEAEPSPPQMVPLTRNRFPTMSARSTREMTIDSGCTSRPMRSPVN